MADFATCSFICRKSAIAFYIKPMIRDAKVFNQSKRKFYAFDICPGCGDALVWHHNQEPLGGIDKVGNELRDGGDDLWQWAERALPESFFASAQVRHRIYYLGMR